MSGKQSCLCRRKDSFFSDDWSLYNHAVKLHGHWFMQWIKNEPMARKPARRGGAIWLCKWAIAIGSQINSPSVTTIFPSLIYGTALPLTPPLCRPWIPATPNQGWMPNFSVSSLKRSKSWDWSDLHRRSPLVAVWMNGSCQGKIRPLVSEPPRFFRKDGSPHSELPWRLAHLSPVEGRANIPQVLPPQPLRVPGSQGQFCQELTVSQPTSFVPGSSFRLSPHEGDSCARTCTGHTAAHGFFQNQSLSPSQDVSKDAGPHGLGITSTTVGPAPHDTPSVLAETTNSAPCVASWMPSHQGEPGLCYSSGPLERPTVVQAGRDYGHDSQKEGCLDRCIQHRLGSSVRGQTSLWLLVGRRRSATHQLPRDDGSMSRPSDLLTGPDGTPRASLLRQHDSGISYKSPRQAHLEMPFRDLGVGTCQTAFIEGITCARRIEPRSRHAISE